MKKQKNAMNLRQDRDSKFRGGSRGSEDDKSLKDCKGSEDDKSLKDCKGSEDDKSLKDCRGSEDGKPLKDCKGFTDFQNPKGIKDRRDSLRREGLALRFLYRTVPGRVLLKILTLPAVSRAAGRILDSRVSVCLIPYFIRKNHICTRRVIVPPGGFRSFNQFFCREEARGRSDKKGGNGPAWCGMDGSGTAGNGTVESGMNGSGTVGGGTGGSRTAGDGPAESRTVGSGTVGNRTAGSGTDGNGTVSRRGENSLSGDGLLSPCDGYLTRIPIRKGVIFDIKHTKFTLEELLKDSKLAQEFQEGCACVFRLTPAEYHRYGYAASGKVLQKRQIPGRLHCVRPIATETVPVFAQNAREYEVIQTAGFDKIVQMEVGALLIGRIANRPAGPGRMVRAGAEKGYFEFGGSTIVVLLKKGILDCPEEAEAGEIYVRRGQRLLTKAQKMC